MKIVHVLEQKFFSVDIFFLFCFDFTSFGYWLSFELFIHCGPSFSLVVIALSYYSLTIVGPLFYVARR